MGDLMKNKTQHTGLLEIVERLPNSYYGNPRYLCRIDGHTCRTKPDSSYAYGEVPNNDGKTVTAVIGTYYGVATIDSIRGAA